MMTAIDRFCLAAAPWMMLAFLLVFVLLFVGTLTDFRYFRYRRVPRWDEPWPFERSSQAGIDAIRVQIENAMADSANEAPVFENDKPVTADTALLAPGEIAIFDESGALIAWLYDIDLENSSLKAACLKSITILTYADMPQAAAPLREQLRVLKGGHGNGKSDNV